MKLKAMTFRDDGEGDPIPDTITVDLTIEELVWIAQAAGKLREVDKPHNFNVYGPACGDVLNRYWDDGADEAARDLNIRMALIATPST